MINYHKVDAKHNSGQKTLKAYITGFVFCIILTMAAFAAVDKQIMTGQYLYILLGVLALVQLVVQAVCFLNLNASPEGRWNLLPFLFTILIIIILVSGSLWIMYNINYNMGM